MDKFLLILNPFKLTFFYFFVMYRIVERTQIFIFFLVELNFEQVFVREKDRFKDY